MEPLIDMKKLLFVVFFCFSAVASAQTLPKPTRMPAPLTAGQTAAIREGIALHDAKKYNEAVAKYHAVLTENPDSTLALYELALTYSAMGDRARSKETALRGAAYISDELGLFYSTIGNALDDDGKPDEAIKVYRNAEEILKAYPDLRAHLSSTYYNLGVTYFRQKKYAEARAELKKAVVNNFGYASPHGLLAVTYHGTRYKVPAFLAAVRLISLEYNTQRTASSVNVITDVLKPAPKDAKTGNINIFLDLNSPKDEGDFGMYDIFLGTLTTVKSKEDKKRSPNQMFVEAISTLVSLIEEDDKLRSTFVGKHYVPFISQLKKSKHVETLGNIVLYLKDNENADAAAWVKANSAKIDAFFSWGRAYNAEMR